ncbi:hypothetical protein EPUS_04100 [Endocarpon pusillum Z07020]|uniref:BTB domain-containing protein n=1 Tax=Endocarpon pusillum (strain Z07020 / HMAS-L-300199) TaxID=1263415 RepID=U1G7R6_ENDPU|nr:uncharacterized protein EPUS_04100 [Endocarpon pusillum Z07020]ERF73477.1 hypothetical protein EPUS_04100 [Endocarpon pusillum Z07020]
MAAKEGSKDMSIDVDEVATDGDVVLIVGSNKTKLRVHSLFLKTASKVLGAKAGTRTSEGQDISKDDAQEVFLPEDDVGAMKTLCAVIHLRSHAASDAFTPSEVLKIAIAADKYDCIVALRDASGHWLKPAENGSIDDLKFLMAAAYLFDNARAFKEITAALILHHTDSYLALAQGQVESLIPRKIFCMLKERRSGTRLKLQQVLVNSAMYDSSDCRCGWADEYAFAYMALLEREILLPENMLSQSIAHLMQRAEQMDGPTPPQKDFSCEQAKGHRNEATQEARRPLHRRSPGREHYSKPNVPDPAVVEGEMSFKIIRVF